MKKQRPKVLREHFEQSEDERLASYAVKSGESRGRVFKEPEHVFRTAFQRDRDRIVYSTAFRRLEYKTQVFVNHEGDHYRTRLTHTVEMTLIARTVGRALRLNEDLIEAVALAHDLGHGPFGHAGEAALARLMKDHGGFEHNQQCLRLVEELEESYSNFPGLNLTSEVREGLKKHDHSQVRSLEADVVDVADSIAYNCHDLDDGLRAGLLDLETTRSSISIWNHILGDIERKYRSLPQNIKIKTAIRFMMNQLVMDLIEQTEQNIKKFKIHSCKDAASHKGHLASFSPPFSGLMRELKQFLQVNLYEHYRVVRMTEKGQRFIQEIFEVYVDKPKQLPPQVLERKKKYGLERCVCDYIAGMTDRFALDERQRLFSPYERV